MSMRRECSLLRGDLGRHERKRQRAEERGLAYAVLSDQDDPLAAIVLESALKATSTMKASLEEPLVGQRVDGEEPRRSGHGWAA